MIYKFLVGSEDAENFKLEIVIDSEDTFLRLRNTILDAAKYNKDESDSFYICDDEWQVEKEVAYDDTKETDSDVDLWYMDETHLDELLEDEGQRLKFVFDYETGRNFFMVLKETIPNKHLCDPLCQRKEGKAPAEKLERELEPKPVKTPIVPNPEVDEFDEGQFYGDEEYNDDELSDLEGFEDADEELK